MMRTVVVAALLVLSAPALASQIEETLDEPCTQLLGRDAQDDLCQYQFDGGSFGDAGDRCLDDNKPTHHGAPFEGIMVPVDDPIDFIQVSAPADGLLTMQIDVAGVALPTSDAQVRLVLLAPDCTTPIGQFHHEGGQVHFGALVHPGDYALGMEIVMPGFIPSIGLPGEDGVINVPVQCRPYCAAQILDQTLYESLKYSIVSHFQAL